MNHFTHRGIRKTSRWHGFIAVALMSLLAVLAWPICDAFELSSDLPGSELVTTIDHKAGESKYHSGEAGLCCVSIDDGTLVNRATLIAASANDGWTFMIAVTGLTAWSIDGPRHGADGSIRNLPRAASPPSNYFARSARILV